MSLAASLTQSLDRLETWRHFFTRMRNESATIELFIGIFGEANLGIELPATLLSSLGSLGVALSLDIYPSDNAPAA